jgi:hypothetical protein
VVGWVELHGRTEIRAHLGDLEVVLLRMPPLRESTFPYVDGPAVIAAVPDLVLVDELAHRLRIVAERCDTCGAPAKGRGKVMTNSSMVRNTPDPLKSSFRTAGAVTRTFLAARPSGLLGTTRTRKDRTSLLLPITSSRRRRDN